MAKKKWKKVFNLHSYEWWRNHRRVVTFALLLFAFGTYVRYLSAGILRVKKWGIYNQRGSSNKDKVTEKLKKWKFMTMHSSPFFLNRLWILEIKKVNYWRDKILTQEHFEAYVLKNNSQTLNEALELRNKLPIFDEDDKEKDNKNFLYLIEKYQECMGEDDLDINVWKEVFKIIHLNCANSLCYWSLLSSFRFN